MIIPRETQDVRAVADHYDELDPFYREIWGSHVHHGLWRTGRESRDEAIEALSLLVAERLGIARGGTLVDIGCGYGATARLLAERFGAEVTGLTVASQQAAHSVGGHGGVTILHRDWLANGLPVAHFDGAYAIESSEHIVDKQLFFAEAHRVLRPGGLLVVCAWLAREHPRPWEVRYLLEPICREGRLPSMGSAREYLAMAAAAGFSYRSFEDLSRQVRRTWDVVIATVLGRALTMPRYRNFLGDKQARNRIFATTLPRLALAYRTGSMRYGLLTLEKEQEPINLD